MRSLPTKVLVCVRLVLDTEVVVAAFRRDRGASRRLLSSALDGECDLLLSIPLIIEYEGVLTRPQALSLATAFEEPGRRDCAGDGGERKPDLLVTFNTRHLANAAGDFGIRVLRPVEAWKQVQKHEQK